MLSFLLTLFFVAVLGGSRTTRNRRSRGSYRRWPYYRRQTTSDPTNEPTAEPTLPGIEEYDAVRAQELNLDGDFPGDNGVPTQFAFRKNYTTVNVDGMDVKMGWIQCGNKYKSNGRPIIFVHGNPASSYLYRNILPFVCEQARGIAVDMPGFGDSDKDFPDYTLSFAISALGAFIEAEGLENVVVVVQDWGGAFGLGYADTDRDNIAGIVFFETTVNTFTFEGLSDPEKLFYDTALSEAIGDENYIAMVENLFFPNSLDEFFWLSPNADLTTAYLHPWTTGTLNDRFVQFVLPQCIPYTDLMALGDSLFQDCREETLDIIESFLPWFIDVNIPKLAFLPWPGSSLTVVTTQTIQNNDIVNLTVSSFIPGVHFLQEDNPHRLGAIISKWLHDTGLAPLEY